MSVLYCNEGSKNRYCNEGSKNGLSLTTTRGTGTRRRRGGITGRLGRSEERRVGKEWRSWWSAASMRRDGGRRPRGQTQTISGRVLSGKSTHRTRSTAPRHT